MDEVPRRDMRTIPIIEMIPWFGKRVREYGRENSPTMWLIICKVCVSSLLISEIKKIIKDSEIVKFVGIWSSTFAPASWHESKGGRHQMASEKQGWSTGTRDQNGKWAHLVWGMLHAHFHKQTYWMPSLTFGCRRQRLVHWWMWQSQRIPKGCEYSIIWCKIWKR